MTGKRLHQTAQRLAQPRIDGQWGAHATGQRNTGRNRKVSPVNWGLTQPTNGIGEEPQGIAGQQGAHATSQRNTGGTARYGRSKGGSRNQPMEYGEEPPGTTSRKEAHAADQLSTQWNRQREAHQENTQCNHWQPTIICSAFPPGTMLHCMSTGTGAYVPGTYMPGEQLTPDPLPWKNYIFIYVCTTWDIPQPENLPKKAIFLSGLRPDGTSHTSSGDSPHLPKTVIFSSPPTAGWGPPLPPRNGGTSHPNGLSTKKRDQ